MEKFSAPCILRLKYKTMTHFADRQKIDAERHRSADRQLRNTGVDANIFCLNCILFVICMKHRKSNQICCTRNSSSERKSTFKSYSFLFVVWSFLFFTVLKYAANKNFEKNQNLCKSLNKIIVFLTEIKLFVKK